VFGPASKEICRIACATLPQKSIWAMHGMAFHFSAKIGSGNLLPVEHPKVSVGTQFDPIGLRFTLPAPADAVRQRNSAAYRPAPNPLHLTELHSGTDDAKHLIQRGICSFTDAKRCVKSKKKA